MNVQPRIAIVGAGLAGLVAAATAARRGALVTVYEATKDVGGRARTREQGGYRFNLGPHALYPGAASVLRELGVSIPGASPKVSGLGLRDGKLRRLPASPWALLQTGLLSPLEKMEFGQLLAGIRKIQLDDWHDRTVAEWVDAASSRPAVRQLLHAFVRLASYTNAPGELSAAAAIGQLAGGANVLYVDGGWRTLTRQLESMVTAAGGAVVTGAHVEAVTPRPGGGVYLATRDAIESFDAVVLTGSPGSVAGMLGEHAATTIRRAADNALPSRAAVLDLALDALPRSRRTFALGIDRPLYMSVHSRTARDLAPGGGATLNLARYIPAGERSDHAAAEEELSAWADAVQPGWREHVAGRGFYPELTVITAIPRADAGGLPGRPGVEDSGIPGVYVAGDWVGPVGLLSDAATASGAAAGAAAVTRATAGAHLVAGVA